MGNCLQIFIKIDKGFQTIPFIGLSNLSLNQSSTQRISSTSEKTWKKITVEDFKFLKILGKGSFGKVFLVEKKDSKKLFAIKCTRKPVLKQLSQKKNNKTERIILEKISSPFLVQLKYAFQSDTKLYLVMDFVEGGDLSHHITSCELSKSQIKLWVAEIVLALECLHENNIIYRDLKPENVLLDKEGHIKLADFGLSKFLKEENSYRTFSFCGTPEYLAPEIIKKQGYNHMIDWWGLGSLIYELIFRKPPFYCESRADMYFEIVHQALEINENLDPVIQNFIKALLKKDPKDRLGAKGIEEIKNHVFFDRTSWDAVKKKEHSFYKPKQSKFKEQPRGEYNYSLSLSSYGNNDLYSDYTYDQTHFKMEKEENGISINQ